MSPVMFMENKRVSVQSPAVACVDVHPVHLPWQAPTATDHLLRHPGHEKVLETRLDGSRRLLDGGACEAKTLHPLVGETSRLIPILSWLKVRADEVLDLGAHFRILKTG